MTTNFDYNFDDQLTSITGSTNVSFTYDGLTRRISRTVGGVTIAFSYNGSAVTTEKQGETLIAHYIYGRDLLSRDDGTNYVYYLVDCLGTARQLTDSNQAVVVSYVFAGFGDLVAQTGMAANVYKFAATSAYRDDGDAGLLHVGLRYYDPSVGRFITADPVLGYISRPQSLNRYVYVENNPVHLVDPSGADWLDVLDFLVVVAIVVVGIVVIAIATPVAVAVGILIIVGGIIVYMVIIIGSTLL